MWCRSIQPHCSERTPAQTTSENLSKNKNTIFVYFSKIHTSEGYKENEGQCWRNSLVLFRHDFGFIKTFSILSNNLRNKDYLGPIVLAHADIIPIIVKKTIQIFLSRNIPSATDPNMNKGKVLQLPKVEKDCRQQFDLIGIKRRRIKIRCNIFRERQTFNCFQ